MSVELLTKEDLKQFKQELFAELKELFTSGAQSQTKKWLKSPEVRKLLSISPGTLQNLRINGTLAFSKVGGIIFYSYDDIQKLLEKNKTRIR